MRFQNLGSRASDWSSRAWEWGSRVLRLSCYGMTFQSSSMAHQDIGQTPPSASSAAQEVLTPGLLQEPCLMMALASVARLGSGLASHAAVCCRFRWLRRRGVVSSGLRTSRSPVLRWCDSSGAMEEHMVVVVRELGLVPALLWLRVRRMFDYIKKPPSLSPEELHRAIASDVALSAWAWLNDKREFDAWASYHAAGVEASPDTDGARRMARHLQNIGRASVPDYQSMIHLAELLWKDQTPEDLGGTDWEDVDGESKDGVGGVVGVGDGGDSGTVQAGGSGAGDVEASGSVGGMGNNMAAMGAAPASITDLQCQAARALRAAAAAVAAMSAMAARTHGSSSSGSPMQPFVVDGGHSEEAMGEAMEARNKSKRQLMLPSNAPPGKARRRE